jgi:hypothetical protein
MRHARVSTVFFCLLAPSFASAATSATTALTPLLVSGHEPIHPKRDVPDDPLAGLPTEDDAKPSHGRGGGTGKGPCKIDAKPVNLRDIGDLRAALAFVERGPRSWPCPGRTVDSQVRLRISVDGGGKITTVEAAGGDAGIASAMARKLVGRAIAPRRDGATAGTVLVTFTPGKGR